MCTFMICAVVNVVRCISFYMFFPLRVLYFDSVLFYFITMFDVLAAINTVCVRWAYFQILLTGLLGGIPLRRSWNASLARNSKAPELSKSSITAVSSSIYSRKSRFSLRKSWFSRWHGDVSRWNWEAQGGYNVSTNPKINQDKPWSQPTDHSLRQRAAYWSFFLH
jgi:hypothetical protein